MEQINFWELVAGLGIFLFGMFLMEEAIKNLSGRAFKKFIHDSTEGRLKSVLAGTFATAILQSSTAVSFMVLAFVGAGVMSMSNAIGVILGSNIGTTLTSWLVATIGFKVNIEILALPFVGIGGLSLILFGKSPKVINFSKLLIGFGFLFMGLDYMKNSIDSLTGIIDIQYLAAFGLPMFILGGFLLTAIIQSSSAAMAIILSAVHSGIINFPAAAAMVIGANIGTTLTILIGTLGAEPIKQRVAYSHFFFNLITAFIAFLLLPFLIYLFEEVFNITKDPVIGLALFHTFFNVGGVIIFFPFIGLFAAFISKLVKEKKSAVTLYLNKLSEVNPDVPEAAILALKKETFYLLQLVLLHNINILNIPREKANLEISEVKDDNIIFKFLPEKLYIHIKLLQAEIFSFTSQALSVKLNVTEVKELNRLLNAARYSVATAKSIKDVRPDLEELYNADNNFMFESYNAFRTKIEENYAVITALVKEKDAALIMPMLLKLREKVNNEDAGFISSLTQAISHKQVSDINISILLAVNRGISISTRQAILSLRDLLLSEEQAAIFENLGEPRELVTQLNTSAPGDINTSSQGS